VILLPGLLPGCGTSSPAGFDTQDASGVDLEGGTQNDGSGAADAADAAYAADSADGTAPRSDASLPPSDATIEAAGDDAAGGGDSSSGSDGGVWVPPDGGSVISPYLIGINYWLSPDLPPLQTLVQQSGVRLIRIGGAGVDADSARSGSYYQTAIQYIRAAGAEPLIQISDNVQATDAATIVNDVNVTGKLNVKFWSIGNEPNLTTGNYKSVAAVGAYVRSFAQAMKGADPSIFIFAPDLAWLDMSYFPSLLGGADDITGKDANGHYYVDGITFHTYPFGNTFTRAQVVGAAAGVLQNAQQLKTLIAAADTQNARTGTSALAWGLTEYNITYANPGNNGPADYGVESFLNGQFFAEVIGVGMAEQAYTVDTWSIHESGGSGNATDLGYIGSVGSLTGAHPRSTYFHIQMLTQDFGGQYAPSTSNLANVKVVATVGASQVAVMILNEDAAATYPFTLSLNGASSSNIAVNAGIAAQSMGTIGPQATQVLVFDLTGTATKRTDFSLTDYQAGNAPKVTKL
jgi:hypothetical protein